MALQTRMTEKGRATIMSNWQISNKMHTATPRIREKFLSRFHILPFSLIYLIICTFSLILQIFQTRATRGYTKGFPEKYTKISAAKKATVGFCVHGHIYLIISRTLSLYYVHIRYCIGSCEWQLEWRVCVNWKSGWSPDLDVYSVKFITIAVGRRLNRLSQHP